MCVASASSGNQEKTSSDITHQVPPMPVDPPKDITHQVSPPMPVYPPKDITTRQKTLEVVSKSNSDPVTPTTAPRADEVVTDTMIIPDGLISRGIIIIIIYSVQCLN